MLDCRAKDGRPRRVGLGCLPAGRGFGSGGSNGASRPPRLPPVGLCQEKGRRPPSRPQGVVEYQEVIIVQVVESTRSILRSGLEQCLNQPQGKLGAVSARPKQRK